VAHIFKSIDRTLRAEAPWQVCKTAITKKKPRRPKPSGAKQALPSGASRAALTFVGQR
jgi:hypothetical protein